MLRISASSVGAHTSFITDISAILPSYVSFRVVQSEWQSRGWSWWSCASLALAAGRSCAFVWSCLAYFSPLSLDQVELRLRPLQCEPHVFLAVHPAITEYTGAFYNSQCQLPRKRLPIVIQDGVSYEFPT